MDIELKQKWADALISDKFTQGTGMLWNGAENSYCCLGVLCKIQGAEWGPWSNGDSPNSEDLIEVTSSPQIDGELLSDYHDELLSPDFMSKIGLTKAQQTQLVNFNDGNQTLDSGLVDKKDFKGIAEFILSPEFDVLGE